MGGRRGIEKEPVGRAARETRFRPAYGEAPASCGAPSAGPATSSPPLLFPHIAKPDSPSRDDCRGTISFDGESRVASEAAQARWWIRHRVESGRPSSVL